MFKNIILITTAIIFVIVSCKKENTNTNSNNASPLDALVKTKTENNITEMYYYDNENRIIKIEYLLANGTTYYHEFTYTNDGILEYHSEDSRTNLSDTVSGGIVIIYCMPNPFLNILNSAGLYKGKSEICDADFYDYKYDDNGFISEKTTSMIDNYLLTHFENDTKNIIRSHNTGYSYGVGSFDYFYDYVYYTDKLNSIGNKNYGQSYLGKSSQNLIKSETINNNIIKTYTYEYDAHQRVSKQIIVHGTTQTITTYTYY